MDPTLDNLPPELRVKRLKEMEEEGRKEIEEAESLIRESVREIKEEEGKKHAPIDQVTAQGLDQLLTAEEKSMFKTARFENSSSEEETLEDKEPGEANLEEVAAEAKPVDDKGIRVIYGKDIDDAKAAMYKGGTVTGQDQEKDLYKSRTTVTGQREEEHDSTHAYQSRGVQSAAYK